MSCLKIDDLVSVDENGFIDGDLAEFYTAYVLRQEDAGLDALPPRQWITRQSRGAARAYLVQKLGDNFRAALGLRREPILIDLAALPKPLSLTSSRLNELRQGLDASDKLWERLGLLLREGAARALLTQTGRVNLSYLSILKGKEDLILGHPGSAYSLISKLGSGLWRAPKGAHRPRRVPRPSRARRRAC